MEETVRIPLKILLVALLAIPACNRNEPRSTQAAPEDRAVTDQMKAERDDYVKAMEARLAEFDQKVDGLDKRADAMAGTTKKGFQYAIDQLRDQRKVVSSKLDDVKNVSVESWATMRGEADAAMADLERSYTHVSGVYEKTPATSPTPKTRTY